MTRCIVQLYNKLYKVKPFFSLNPMEEKTFYRIIFTGLLLTAFISLYYLYPLVKPYPKLEYQAPEIPEVPNWRDPRDWEKIQEAIPFTIDPMYIYLGIGISALIIVISIVVYYRRKEEI
ncbi:MAG: hypothetical protein ACTSRG_24290 [Candidatus Helarchaeota archaeon]